MKKVIAAIIAVFFLGGGAYIYFDRINDDADLFVSQGDPIEYVSEPPIPDSPPAPEPAPTSQETAASLVFVPLGQEFVDEKIEEITSPPELEKNESFPIPHAPCAGGAIDLFLCYDEYYQRLTKIEGVEAAIADLKTRYDAEPFIRSQCHQLIHVVGRGAAQMYGGNVSESYFHGDSFCWSGYYHGVLEQIITNANKEEMTQQPDTLCADISGKEQYSFDYFNCVHGLGHGFMFLTGDELFESLTICDNLTGGWEQSACWGGIFMQNIIADEVNHRRMYLKDDDPLYPCSAVEDRYKSTCYLMQTSHMLKVVGYDFSKVFEICAGLEDSYINLCYQSLGRDASGKTVSDIVQTKTSCLLGADYRQRSNCVIGAAKDFVSYHHSDVEAKQLCAALPEDLQPVCFVTVKNYYIYF